MIVAAELSQPVDPDDGRQVRLLGREGDQPEREGCRSAFAAHAAALRAPLACYLTPVHTSSGSMTFTFYAHSS
ncbi:hypothetical protein MUU72_14595 [Streptomyces sp. RS10V-4]|uniref:hypothetical protein n=1 Tax=Streptomyces rhizoryzae TaxID=2932493 RepID=UPI002006C41E|nr:hypothetical protein [Streptomyces rhizoryzae]MCK7624316.1 hypothetical protein [Streptomyces rhizoryzae]